MAISPQATRSLRRVRVRTPGSKLVIHYSKRKPSVAKCANCKSDLKGIPRERPAVFRNLTLSEKTVSRPFGGNLCSDCSREAIISRFKDKKDLPLDIGQLCVKTAGKEAGKICVIVDKVDDAFVLIDGQVKRRKCNIFHLKTIEQSIEIKNNESHEKIKHDFEKLGYKITEKKVKEKSKEIKTEKVAKKPKETSSK